MKTILTIIAFIALFTSAPIFAQVPTDTLVCEGHQVIFTIPAQPGATVQWQISPDGVIYTDISGKTGDTLEITATSNSWYRAYISGPTCDPYTSASMEVKLGTEPSSAYAGPDINTQQVTTSLAAATPLVGVGSWRIISGTGGSIADPSDPASDFTGQANTTYLLEWRVSNPPCPAKADTVTVNIGSGITIPSITCNGQTLYVHPMDNGGPIAWGCSGIVSGASDDWNGQANTSTIMGMCPQPNAAAICANLNDLGFNDWYLPAYNELECLRSDAATIGGFQADAYWSSTEGTAPFSANARYRTFPSGVSGYGSKSNQNLIRCVRK